MNRHVPIVASLLSLILTNSLVAQPVPASQPSTRPAPQHADVAAPKPDTGRFMQLHNQYIDRAKQGDIDLVFLGDSITEGWGGRGKEIWDKYYANRKAVYFGIGGDQTQHVLWRIQNGELEGISPKALVLMIGTNNTSTHPTSEITHGIELIVKTIRQKLPNTKILLLGIFPRNRQSTEAIKANEEIRMKQINEINPIIAKLDDGKMVRYLNFNEKFLGPDGKVPADIMPDFLHPNAKGYQIWVDAMTPMLEEMTK